ncbi:MAG: hypothetical protein JST22_15925 [Bacteroidetes bacterium]|nr:hypothetical protein [Bacteroidota bacterium]
MQPQADPVPSPYTCDTFLPHVGNTFVLTSRSGSAVDLELITAEPVKLNPIDGRAVGRSGFVRRDPFRLLFRGHGEMLPQGLYGFRHETMGDFQMSVVPVGPGESGWLYEAVFN